MSTDDKILQALTDQGKLLAALQTDMATVKGVQQEQGGVLAQHGKALEAQGKLLGALHADVTTVKETLREQGAELKEVSGKLTRVEKDLKLVLKYHDENVIRLRSRIERLEEHTGLDNS